MSAQMALVGRFETFCGWLRDSADVCTIKKSSSISFSRLDLSAGVNLVTDIRRKWTEANMIAGPAWMLDRRTFATATGATRGRP
jgi:hypothetical protein